MRRQKNKVFLMGAIMKGFKRFSLCLSLSLAILSIGTIYQARPVQASESENTVSDIFVPDEYRSWVQYFNTSRYGGDVIKTIRFDLMPLIKTLATGTVPNDEFTWSFENAPLYVESYDVLSVEQEMGYSLWCMQPDHLKTLLYEALVGIYDLNELGYTTETRLVTDDYGGICYRCAVTGVFVKSWGSPYGDICSREEALDYCNKCSAKIKSIVSKVISAHLINDAERLKWIHDWLIRSADYASEKLSLYKTDKEKYKFKHLWNEYGAIMDGEAVCQGYTYAFKAIVDELVEQTGVHIECEEAIDNNHTHSWVRVKLNGKWYHIDLVKDEALYSFLTFGFLFSDEFLEEEYRDYYSINSSVKATSTEYNLKHWDIPFKKDLSEYTIVVKDPTEDDLSTVIEVKYGVNTLSPEDYKITMVYKITEDSEGVYTVKSVLRIIPACYDLSGSVEIPGSEKPVNTFLSDILLLINQRRFSSRWPIFVRR